MKSASNSYKDEAGNDWTLADLLADLDRKDYLYLTPKMCADLAQHLRQCGPKGGWTDGDYLDQALTNATGSILSQYAADVIRKRAIELRLSATHETQEKT